MAEAAPRRMSYEQYLAAEAVSATKHEYLRGEVFVLGGEAFAKIGHTPTHARLAMAVGTALSNALADRPCEVYSSDLRVRIEATDLSTYPDVTVVYGRFETSNNDANANTNPVLIVEVLSDATEAYDRGEKFAHYRRLPSLREYVLVSQHEPRIESYYRNNARNDARNNARNDARNDAGEWVLTEARSGETLALRSLDGVRLTTDLIYRDRLASD